jgi:hypothetical protein
MRSLRSALNRAKILVRAGQAAEADDLGGQDRRDFPRPRYNACSP